MNLTVRGNIQEDASADKIIERKNATNKELSPRRSRRPCSFDGRCQNGVLVDL